MQRTAWIVRILAAVLSLGQAFAAESHVTGGPMPGYPAMRAAQIWLQASGAAQADIEFWPVGKPNDTQVSPAHALTADDDFSGKVTIGGLEPGTTYEYRMRLDGVPQPAATPLRFHTQPLWQWRTDPPAFTVALGSCAYINEAAYDRPGTPYGGGYEIFDTIAAMQPTMMLWLGDNIYLREADYDSPYGMNYRYRHVRSFAPLQRLLHGTHHVATWDDHDFGPDNTNGSFVLKGMALELFQRYWANPSYGLPQVPGVFTVISYGDADFFLLDDRYYRHSDDAPDSAGKTMLGTAQVQWLKDALLASDATFKFIANGSQLLFGQPRTESWVRFPEERQRFLDWLALSKITGVVFLSGDRHMTRLYRQKRAGTYPLYELTCSPLTSSARNPVREIVNSLAVDGTRVGERNFCTLGINGPRKQRVLTLRVHSTQGKLLWERKIQERELQ